MRVGQRVPFAAYVVRCLKVWLVHTWYCKENRLKKAKLEF